MLASTADLFAARTQMALSLGWHIVLACFGVGMPVLVGFCEWRAQATDDAIYRELAKRWAKITAVLFAVGAVSGTILSFELGVLWPGLMGTFGEVIGLPFAIEGIAFFLEAIFLGIYLYGGDRLSPRARALSLVPVALSGAASAFVVVTANAWMNQPRGFDVGHYRATGEVVGVEPWAAMFNPATPVQTTHMLLAAYMVTGFAVAAVYAWRLRRAPNDAYARRGFAIAFALGAALTLPQMLVGDWAAQFIADDQPIKLAAAEGLEHTQRDAPLHLPGGLEIPHALSLLAQHDPHAEVIGLDAAPAEARPPSGVVHIAFQLMVGAGTLLFALAAWAALVFWRRRTLPQSPWFFRAAVVAGPAAALALEAGWVVTEVGRQPWIVYEVMKVGEAVSRADGLRAGLYLLVAVYAALTVATVYVLRRIARRPA